MSFRLIACVALIALTACTDQEMRAAQRDIDGFFASLSGRKPAAPARTARRTTAAAPAAEATDPRAELRRRVEAGEITEAEAAALLRNSSTTATATATTAAPGTVTLVGTQTRIDETDESRNSGQTRRAVGASRVGAGGSTTAAGS